MKPIHTDRTARGAAREVRTMQRGQSAISAVLFLALVGILALGALVGSGYISGDAVGTVFTAWGGGIAVILANLMGGAALPVLLVAGVALLIFGHGTAMRIAAAGLLFAVVAGLWHFGGWDWLTHHGGDITSRFLNRTR